MVKTVRAFAPVNTYIRGSEDGYVVQRGGREKRFKDRFQAVDEDPGMETAWKWIKGGVSAHNQQRIATTETHELLPGRKATTDTYTVEGQKVQMTTFREQGRTIAVQVVGHDPIRGYTDFWSNNRRDVRLIEGAEVLMQSRRRS